MYAPTSVMDDLLDNSANVTVTLSEIKVTEAGGLLVVVGVRLELKDAPLCQNHFGAR